MRIFDRSDGMQYVEELPLVERQFEDGGEPRRQCIEAHDRRFARYSKNCRGGRTRGGVPEALGGTEVISLLIKERAVIGLRDTDLGDQARGRFIDGKSGHR